MRDACMFELMGQAQQENKLLKIIKETIRVGRYPAARFSSTIPVNAQSLAEG
jgi:hypothetical protein